MSLTLLTPPTGEPITLADAKTHLRVDDTTDDTLIALLLTAARQWAEEACGISLLPQTWRLTLASFPRFITGVGSPPYLQTLRQLSERRYPDAVIPLRRGPVRSITSISYVDTAGANQTLGTATYSLDAARLLGAVSLTYGSSWPDTRDLGPHGAAVTIDYVTGYADAASVPAMLKAAILLQLGDLYVNRESQVVGSIITENETACRLIAPYRVVEAV